MPLKENFYTKDTLIVAKSLLGQKLIHYSNEGITSGMIVEVEAYFGIKDPASHGYNGETKRTRALYGDPGYAYIYFSYGLHYCFNVVTAPKGIGEAVLIRAIEPIEGVTLMQKRRNMDDLYNLTNGPAKLVYAMGITKEHYGDSLVKSSIQIHKFRKIKQQDIITTTRIGITKAKESLYRFYIKDNSFVSKK